MVMVNGKYVEHYIKLMTVCRLAVGVSGEDQFQPASQASGSKTGLHYPESTAAGERSKAGKES